jgi:hypothetical protein
MNDDWWLDSHEHDFIETLESVTNLSVRAADAVAYVHVLAATSLVENGMEETNNGRLILHVHPEWRKMQSNEFALDVIRQMSELVLIWAEPNDWFLSYETKYS